MSIRHSITGRILALAICVFLAQSAAGQSVLYVDAGATGANNGTSWADAYNYLQDALAAASSDDQIWVAADTYTPDQGALVMPGDREATFQLIKDVAIYGGFPTGGGGWEDRDPGSHETTFSGDIGVLTAEGDNSYHVVTASETDATAVLDGFTITGGRADGPSENNQSNGAGMYSNNGNPTLANCTFSANSALQNGGGVWSNGRDLTLTNCTFTGNSAQCNGGGMSNKSRRLTMTNCTFSENSAQQDGGGMWNDSSTLTVTDCTFSGNTAQQDGGGMWNNSSTLTLNNCTFNGNAAQRNGGGMWNNSSTLTMTICTFSRNSAQQNGGGVWNNSSTLTATNCAFSRNSAQYSGGGMWNDGSSLIMINCTFSKNSALSNGGGLYCYCSSTTINDCTLSNNRPDAVWIEGGTARVVGTVRVVSNDLAGSGTLHIDHDATLALDHSLILCNLSGTGTIQADIDSELVIKGDVIIDLGDPTDPNANGEIQGGALLRVEDDAQILNAKIKISRASFEDNATISNSVIFTDANAPPGQISIGPNTSMTHIDMYVNGDRYMDLDPSVFEGTFHHIRIFVTITEGQGQAQGGLFELRGKDDLVSNSCELDQYMCQVGPWTIPDCSMDTWSIEWVKFERGTKLNLTNRFPFQPPYDPGSDDDVLYVKKLILSENSVLNTAYNRVYFETLEMEPNAVITHVPLLGFSLITITFGNKTEFIVRVTHNNYEHPEYGYFNRNHVRRITGLNPDPNGMMQMCNIVDLDPNSLNYGQVVNARAKGMFAKANEDQILIEFEYMFIDDPCDEAELIVYLSDKSEVDANLVEVARIQPPAPNQPGSVGSDSFAVFSGSFPRGDLNFYRGTYVGLELCGTSTCCWIDNLDPQVNCIAICGDFHVDMFNVVDVYDYLALLAEFGLTSPGSAGKGCLDLVTDGCINTADLSAWGVDEVLNKCPSAQSTFASAHTATSETLPSIVGAQTQYAGESESLLVFGKPPSGIGADVPDSYLYSIDSNGTCTVDANGVESDGRFVTDSDGNIYQVNADLGLIRHDTAAVVVQPDVIDDGNNLISIGFNDGEGLLLADAAFKRGNPNTVYVVPVQVDPQDGNCPYMAAAKLELIGAGNYNLLKLYGKNPATDPCQSITITDCNDIGDFAYEPDVQHLHEIEIDSAGNLFVLSAYWLNENNWILIYDEAVGNDSEVRVSLNDANMVAPTSMVVSSSKDKMYLTSSANTSNDLTAEVYCFSIDKTDHNATGLTYDKRLDINCPEPDICDTNPSLCDPALGFIAATTSMIENPEDGTLYVTGFTAPKFPEDEALPSQIDEIFTTPILAVLPPDANEPVEAAKITSCDPSLPLVLPLSIVWAGPSGPLERCGGADLDESDDVSFTDFAILAQYWLQSNCAASDDCSGADLEPEGNPDGDVDTKDLAVFAEQWLATGCLGNP